MFMNVNYKLQLKAHDDLQCALTEANRLSEKLNTKIYTAQVLVVTTPEPDWPANHGKEWSREDDASLLINYMSGKFTPRELAPMYKRTVWSIQCRLHDLGLGRSQKDQNYRGW